MVPIGLIRRKRLTYLLGMPHLSRQCNVCPWPLRRCSPSDSFHISPSDPSVGGFTLPPAEYPGPDVGPSAEILDMTTADLANGLGNQQTFDVRCSSGLGRWQDGRG
ncbi:hypothetical protein XENTR_v10017592 [Xenopus tropicalis]|nr:hypothetical protein XENTR_v10017592 [Xenopus tropicalis]